MVNVISSVDFIYLKGNFIKKVNISAFTPMKQEITCRLSENCSRCSNLKSFMVF